MNITKLDYPYDPAGRILSVTNQLDSTNPWKATGYNGANPYDAASQLTTGTQARSPANPHLHRNDFDPGDEAQRV